MTDQTDGAKVTAQTKAVAKNFREKVRKLVDVDSDRTLLFEALREYKSDMDVEKLVDHLSEVLNHPDRLPLFQEIRMMIPPRHHLTYNSLVPPPPSNNMRVVVVKRHSKNPFGFTIRGGKEHHCGIFITSVQPGSVASTADLKVGEQVLSIDGYPISELIHEEVLNWLRRAKSIKLRLQAVGMLPVQTESGAIRWELVSGGKRRKSITQHEDDEEPAEAQETVTRRIATLNLGERRVTIEKSGEPLGCGIVGGTQTKKGIFIGAVQPNSLAAAAGLKDGDQLMSVNGIVFLQLKHAEAIRVLKSSDILMMTVKSEQDSEQQKEWEEQMANLREQRLLEFASARPSFDSEVNEAKGPFFIASPPDATSPLSEPSAGFEEDDDLGSVDVYKEAPAMPEEKEPSPVKETADKSLDQLGDTINVVQTHLQRLYLEQQRERHDRLRKRSQQRMKLLEEVRSMRKVSTEGKDDGGSQDNTKERSQAEKRDELKTEAGKATLTVKHKVAEEVSAATAVNVVNEVITTEQAQQPAQLTAVVTQQSAVATVAKKTAVLEEGPMTIATVTMAAEGTSVNSHPERPLSAASTSSQPDAITASVPSEFADDPEEDTLPQLHVRQAKDDAPQRPSSLVANEADRSAESAVVVQPSLVKALSQVSDQRKAEEASEAALRSSADESLEGKEPNRKDGSLNYVQVEFAPPNKDSGQHVVMLENANSKKTAYSEVIVQPVRAKESGQGKSLPGEIEGQQTQEAAAASKEKLTKKGSARKEESAKENIVELLVGPLPAHSALKKPGENSSKVASGTKSKKKQMKKQASFATNVECVMISRSDSILSHNKRLSSMSEDLVNPSNMEFSDEVLQGRQAIFHTIPKYGPLGIKLRGGKGSRHGNSITISQIDPDGSVGQYGQLVVGDQILNVEGTSFLDISQKEASEALYEAMQWETDCIDLVVASELTTI